MKWMRRGLDLRFHTPNALHVKGISPDAARLLFLAGFRTLRLGMETSDMDLQRETGGKVAEGEFQWDEGKRARVQELKDLAKTTHR